MAAGTWATPLIARLQADGVAVWQLDLPLDRRCHGVELSVTDMPARGAPLRRVRVECPEGVD